MFSNAFISLLNIGCGQGCKRRHRYVLGTRMTASWLCLWSLAHQLGNQRSPGGCEKMGCQVLELDAAPVAWNMPGTASPQATTWKRPRRSPSWFMPFSTCAGTKLLCKSKCKKRESTHPSIYFVGVCVWGENQNTFANLSLSPSFYHLKEDSYITDWVTDADSVTYHNKVLQPS